MLETGQSSIHPTVMHNYLRELEQCVPDIPYIHQMKYLNYALSKEHVQSLYHLHIYFDSSVNQGVYVLSSQKKREKGTDYIFL